MSPITYNLPVIIPVLYPDEIYRPVDALIQMRCNLNTNSTNLQIPFQKIFFDPTAMIIMPQAKQDLLILYLAQEILYDGIKRVSLSTLAIEFKGDSEKLRAELIKAS